MPADTTYLETPPQASTDTVCELIGTAGQAVELIAELELQRRLIEARQVNLLAEIEASGVTREHGHASAKVMMRHNAKLSGAEAAARDKVNNLVRRCHHINMEFQAGRIGVDQIRVLGRVFANRRVRPDMIDQVHRLVRISPYDSSARRRGAKLLTRTAPTRPNAPTKTATAPLSKTNSPRHGTSTPAKPRKPAR